MPGNSAQAYATASITHGSSNSVNSASSCRPHASALPQYGEYVVESPAGITSAPALPPVQEKDNYVFCDPIAFRYIEEDPCTQVLQRRAHLYGYEVYLVEQWACSRTHPTFVIATFTGDPAHQISASVLRIPRDETRWSPRLKLYFDAVRQYNARPKETELGTFMVTNLSSFPSALTVVPVPGGDVKAHRIEFIINENLKRMGCSGRSALSLAPPTDASQMKFMQLYKTSDKIPFYSAVIDLVRLCQIALMAFEKFKLNPCYADGLLCDVTETALRRWWSEVGVPFYRTEPNDGTLGPTTVAALLGMVLGAKHRLGMCGAPAPKDAFDLSQLEKAIYHFQRAHRLQRTKHLDAHTVRFLREASQKSSSTAADIFAVPRAIRTTVADFSARATGGSSSVDLSSIETTDLERFIPNISGESCKFLWQGKPRKTPAAPFTTSNTPSRQNSVGGASFSDDESPGPLPSHSHPIPEFSAAHMISTAAPGISYHSSSHSSGDISDLRKAVFRSMTGRMKDVASGISAGTDYIRGRGGSAHSSSRHKTPPNTAVSAAAPPTPQCEDISPENSLRWKTSASTISSSGGAAAHPHLLRRCSLTEPETERNINFYPRRLSFSVAEDALSSWTLPFSPVPSPPPSPRFVGFCARAVAELGETQEGVDAECEALKAVYCDSLEVLERGYEDARVQDEVKQEVTEKVIEAETAAARLEYEMGVVAGRIRDLEDAVVAVERVVLQVEGECEVLQKAVDEREGRGWWGWWR